MGKLYLNVPTIHHVLYVFSKPASLCLLKPSASHISTGRNPWEDLPHGVCGGRAPGDGDRHRGQRVTKTNRRRPVLVRHNSPLVFRFFDGALFWPNSFRLKSTSNTLSFCLEKQHLGERERAPLWVKRQSLDGPHREQLVPTISSSRPWLMSVSHAPVLCLILLSCDYWHGGPFSLMKINKSRSKNQTIWKQLFARVDNAAV